MTNAIHPHTVVKDEDRRSLSVDKNTRARLQQVLFELQLERGVRLSQDDIIREALDALDEKRKRK
jgi:hypothetical protein